MATGSLVFEISVQKYCFLMRKKVTRCDFRVTFL